MRTVFVNGEYVPEDQAQVSIFDRGFLFADAVYEVTAVLNGKLIDFDSHIKRLGRSLGELGITAPLSDDDLLAMHRNLVEKNTLKEGVVYMQITRGATDRDFDFSSMQARPTIIAFTQEKKLEANPKFDEGQHIILAEDLRWGRSDIKTTQLLYASLVKTHAKKSGVDDVWMHRDGTITEGSSNNAYIVTHAGEVVTRNLSNHILHGITRNVVNDVAISCDLTLIERPFTIDELMNAKEAFTTSASGFVNPVVKVEGKPIGTGQPGEVSKLLLKHYLASRHAEAI